jgi:ATP-binding cassette subfamily F protein 3
MAVLTASGLGKYFGAQDVFSGVSVQIAREDRIGLVGPNGVGKTTLLRILAGLEEPDAGTVQRAKGLRIGYLPQDPELAGDRTLHQEMLTAFEKLLTMQHTLRELEQAMGAPDRGDEVVERYGRLSQEFEEAGGYLYESRIRRVLAGLGFAEEQHNLPLGMLSGGQRTRALLGRLLLEDSDLLLLDEPTVYLDLEAMEWFEHHLVEWPKAVVAVAHDRYFLDVVATRMWDMEFGGLEQYRGNYSHYARTKAERMARRMIEYEAQQEEIKKTEDFIRRYKAGQRTKQAQGRETRLARLERLEKPRQTRDLKLSLDARVRGGDNVLVGKDLRIGYENGVGKGREAHELFRCEELLLLRGEKVALLGPNGSGKTTFVRTVLEEVPVLGGKVVVGQNVHPGYLPQSRDELEDDLTVLDQLLAAKNLPLGKARSFLARFLFTGDDVFKRIGDLSGGERTRVSLALLTLLGANFLMLDEPTTHLDLGAQEALQRVLSEFEGSVLLVTHDRYLVRAVATQVWEIRDGRLCIYRGNYDDYLSERQKERLREDNRTMKEASVMRSTTTRPKAQRKGVNPRQVDELEQRVGELEQRLAWLEKDLGSASEVRDIEQVRRLSVEYETLQSELESCLEQWGRLTAEAP